MAEKSVYREEVVLEGHIIDSLLLPKVLDTILEHGGDFELLDVRIGRTRQDPSFARIAIVAPSETRLDQILRRIGPHGAVPIEQSDCQLTAADMDGAFPEGFYSTTNQPTEVRIKGRWIPVDDQEMDCGIVVDLDSLSARCVPMSRVRAGDLVVVGHRGIRVVPVKRPELLPESEFGFMTSEVSIEKPKRALIAWVAEEMRRIRNAQQKIILVGGPAIVHTGSVPHVCKLIERGYVDVLFAGNALAAHDIEHALYGTSLGVYVDRGEPARHGHEHHLRAINTIRRLGGIAEAVRRGVLKSGIMYECVRHNVPFVLAGSIRDDGPLPEVITDVLAAQEAMRSHIREAGMALMIATGLHAIATGNLLPAEVTTVYVDINPAIVTKIADRGSLQTVGIVTDVDAFLRQLVTELEANQPAG